jgi:hypothetical protein
MINGKFTPPPPLKGGIRWGYNVLCGYLPAGGREVVSNFLTVVSNFLTVGGWGRLGKSLVNSRVGGLARYLLFFMEKLNTYENNTPCISCPLH